MDVSAARLESTDDFHNVYSMEVISCCLFGCVCLFLLLFLFILHSPLPLTCSVGSVFHLFLNQHPERTTELKETDSAVV